MNWRTVFCACVTSLQKRSVLQPADGLVLAFPAHDPRGVGDDMAACFRGRFPVRGVREHNRMKIVLRGTRSVHPRCRRIGERRGLLRRSLMSAALGRRLRLFFLLKLEDARVGLIGHFRKQQQVVATETLRALPLIAVLVEAGKGDIVPRAVVSFVQPNRSLDATDAEFRDGFGVS